MDPSVFFFFLKKCCLIESCILAVASYWSMKLKNWVDKLVCNNLELKAYTLFVSYKMYEQLDFVIPNGCIYFSNKNWEFVKHLQFLLYTISV